MMNVLKLSIDLQRRLIRDLVADSHEREMLNYIVGQVGEALVASACAIYTIDPGGDSATQVAGTGYQREGVGSRVPVVSPDRVVEKPAPQTKLGLTGWILSTGKSFLAESYADVSNHPHWLGVHDPEMLGANAGARQPGQNLRLATFLGVPLRGVRGEVIGMIKAERRERPGAPEKPFTVHEQILLETVARVAGKSLAYDQMAGEGRTAGVARPALDRAITAWARDAIAEVAASEVEMDSFLTFVSQVVAAAMEADSCGIYLIDESKQTLTQRAGCGDQEPLYVIRSYPLPTREQIESTTERVGLTAWIAAAGESFHARNFEELKRHPHHRGAYDRWNYPEGTRTLCGAWLGVPLRVGGRVIGVIKVENRSMSEVPDPRDFSEQARRRFDLLAGDVALAIVRLQEERLPARFEVILRAQPTIFGILQGGMDVQTLVEKVVKDIALLFNARACSLFLKEGNRLIRPRYAAVGWAARGPDREYPLADPSQLAEQPARPEDRVSITVWIASTRNKFVARSNLELTRHPHHAGKYDRYDFAMGERCESFMGVPLIVGDKLVGVLKVETKQEIERVVGTGGQLVEQTAVTYFSEQDELVFDLIARSAAIAIENARIAESERLADKIRSQSRSVLVDLHDFVADHLWASETLDRAANSLRGDSPSLARIVQDYSDLLEPQVTPLILEGFAGQMVQYGDFLDGSRGIEALYRAFAEALRVRSVVEIANLCGSRQNIDRLDLLMGHRPFIADAARVLGELYLGVGCAGQLAGRAALNRAREQLTGIRMRALGVARPERDVLVQIADHWQGVIAHEQPFVKVEPNPYVVGKPIDPQRGSFFGRRDVFEWVKESLYNTPRLPALVLHGERRMGKTSILLQLASGDHGRPLREHAERPLCPIYVNLEQVVTPSTATLLYRLSQLIDEGTKKHRGGAAVLPPAPSLDQLRHTPDVFNDYVAAVANALSPGLLVLMLDEFEYLEIWVNRPEGERVSPDVYGLLRGQMQFLPNVGFIVAGSHQLDEISPRNQSLIFTVALHREVGFMGKEEANALVREPVAETVVYEQAAVDELVHITHGHPYLLQVLCFELIADMNRKMRSNIISLGDVNAAIDRLGREGARRYLVHILSSLSPEETAFLQAAARIADRGGTELTAAALADELRWSGERLTDTLPRLVRRRLIEEVTTPAEAGPAEVCYRPTMPLVSRWLLALP
jgi:GAF domain-containing protein